MIRTVTLRRPFWRLHPSCYKRFFVRVVIVSDSDQVRDRFNCYKGAKCAEPMRGYWCCAKALGDYRRWNIDGEICIAATSFDAGTVAHEAYHCAMHAKRNGILMRSTDGWEETIALAVDSLTLTIINRCSGIVARWRKA